MIRFKYPIASLLILLLIPVSSTSLASLRPSAQPLQQAPIFADPAFQQIWERTDAPVAGGQAQRSWYWGPQPGEVRSERYSGNSVGARLVQYFDKARMEVNNSGGDRSSQWFVTTGLLVSEMVSGKQQVGDRQFNAIGAAEIAVGGDGLGSDPDAPTYTSFRPVASLTGPGSNYAPSMMGQSVTATINRAGVVGDNPAFALYPGGVVAAYSEELGHNIPKAMWDFLNLKGLVIEGGAPVDNSTIADWVFVMGYPITEPYWARVRIEGIYYDAMFQMYQRRALAYIPSFPEGWQVQMGNVGAHYYRWLYGGPLPTPLVQFTPTPTATPSLEPTATPTATPFAPTGTSVPSVPPATPSQQAMQPTSVPTPEPTLPPAGTPGAATPTPTYPVVPTEPPGGLIVAVRPPFGPPDAVFTFDASGLNPGEEVQVAFTDATGAVVYPAGSNGGRYLADSAGRLVFSLVPAQSFPAAPLGTWLLEVSGLGSGRQTVVGFALR